MHWILSNGLQPMMLQNLPMAKHNTVVCPMTVGGIVDDLLVYCIEENKVYMLVVNATNIEKDWNWISKYNKKMWRCIISLIKPVCWQYRGPMPQRSCSHLPKWISEPEILHFVKGKFAGVDNVLISATGYTGAGGVEIYFEDRRWCMPIKYGMPFLKPDKLQGLKPIGLGARDTLRLEMGFCFMEMILMIPLLHWKRVLDGSPNSPKTLPPGHILENSKKEGSNKKTGGF